MHIEWVLETGIQSRKSGDVLCLSTLTSSVTKATDKTGWECLPSWYIEAGLESQFGHHYSEGQAHARIFETLFILILSEGILTEQRVIRTSSQEEKKKKVNFLLHRGWPKQLTYGTKQHSQLNSIGLSTVLWLMWLGSCVKQNIVKLQHADFSEYKEYTTSIFFPFFVAIAVNW